MNIFIHYMLGSDVNCNMLRNDVNNLCVCVCVNV